ncbi:hypothetical protein J27TS7_35350 [Paenibacillus dendritiformis]|nr:hypothetical protein J27TS7_35350 [Paenibacillus dendritiformis]
MLALTYVVAGRLVNRLWEETRDITECFFSYIGHLAGGQTDSWRLAAQFCLSARAAYIAVRLRGKRRL